MDHGLYSGRGTHHPLRTAYPVAVLNLVLRKFSNEGTLFYVDVNVKGWVVLDLMRTEPEILKRKDEKMRVSGKLSAILGLALLLAGCATAPGTPPPPTRVNVTSLPAGASAAAQAPDALSRAILADINAYRASYKLQPLANDAMLQRAAAVHSADMATRGFFGHFNPDGQGPGERIKALSPDFHASYGENIAINESSQPLSPEALAAKFVKQWIASPSHRKNIRNGSFMRSGVGIARAGNRVYATQLFAAP